MKALLITLGSVSSNMLQTAMEKYFSQVDMINIKDIDVVIEGGELKILAKGKPLGKYDCVYPKSSFRYALVLKSIANAFFNKCYVPVNPEAFVSVNDKTLTHIELSTFKVPQPVTYVSATPESAKAILKQMNYPIVMKIPSGTQGKGVMFAESYSAASSLLDTLDKLNQPFLLQEYIDTEGEDIRAIVVNGEVVATMMRKSKSDEKRSNIHMGGIGLPVEINEKTKYVATLAAKAVGADICGVDILQSHRGPLVLEVNLSPGLQGITKATKDDVADKIAKGLYEKTKQYIKDKKGRKELKDVTSKTLNNVLSSLDFRGGRVLLPDIITRISDFSPNNEYVINAKDGEISIKRL